MTFRVWADIAQRVRAPCCGRQVAADMLVYYGDLSDRLTRKIVKRLPRTADRTLYLCDGCRETLLREGILRKKDCPRKR